MSLELGYQQSVPLDVFLDRTYRLWCAWKNTGLFEDSSGGPFSDTSGGAHQQSAASLASSLAVSAASSSSSASLESGGPPQHELPLLLGCTLSMACLEIRIPVYQEWAVHFHLPGQSASLLLDEGERFAFNVHLTSPSVHFVPYSADISDPRVKTFELPELQFYGSSGRAEAEEIFRLFVLIRRMEASVTQDFLPKIIELQGQVGQQVLLILEHFQNSSYGVLADDALATALYNAAPPNKPSSGLGKESHPSAPPRLPLAPPSHRSPG
eukprot:RCo037441